MNATIAVIFTGGTLSMKLDAQRGGAVPALAGEEILAQIHNLPPALTILPKNHSLLPGPHMIPSRMMALARDVETYLADPTIAGVVVTHGTDTLEESAYLHELVLRPEKPVIFVGAMRNSSEVGWDGPANLATAIRVAADPRTAGLGVLVVMNDQILSAVDATKTHTEAVNTFQGRDFGPLGVVDKERIILTRAPTQREPKLSRAMEERVELIQLSSGANGRQIDHAIADGARGLILVGLGRGNIPPEALPSIDRALATRIPIVITSRCPQGRVLDTYAYEGGGRQLRDRGVILGGFLPGHKARIKLMLLLGADYPIDRVRSSFEIF